MSYLSYLLTLCSLYQFLSPYQSFVVLPNFCQFLTPCYLFTFYVNWQPINAPAVHTTNTTLLPFLSCARSLREYNFLTHQASLAIVPFCYGGEGIEAWLGVVQLELRDIFSSRSALNVVDQFSCAPNEVLKDDPDQFSLRTSRSVAKPAEHSLDEPFRYRNKTKTAL